MLIKYPFLDEEVGAEGPTSEGGEEVVAAEESEGGEESFDFDAWLNDDEDEEEVDEEAEVEDEEEVDAEEEEEVEEVVEEKEEEPEVPETWTLKVDGEEIAYDPKDVEQTKTWVQKGMAAQKTWQEAGKIRNQVNKFVEDFKTNPRALLENPVFKIDAVKVAEEILYDKLQEENMSESEKQMRAELRELRAKEQGKLIEEQQRQAQENQRRNEEILQNIQDNLKAAGLPVNQDNVDLVATYFNEARDAGQPVEVKDVMDYVKRDFQAKQKEYVNSLGVEQLMEFLGKDTVDKIRQHNVKKVIEKRKAAAPKKVAKPAKKSEKPRIGDLSDWLNR